jgi:peptide/nickel transport system substrate-binding protein
MGQTISARVRTPLGKVLAASGLTLALLGSSTTFASQQRATAQVKMGGTLTIDNVSGSLWTCGFNPYSPSVAGLSAGVFYESLYYINPLNDKQTPMLATASKWSNGNKTLTFTIRKGVKWTDGKALTPADVAFTFNLLKKNAGLDLNAIWTVLKSVTAKGNTVVLQFKSPSVPYYYFIAGQTFIVPQHLWASIKNPVTYSDNKPVGTGPFTLSKCSPQNVEYVRNPHYWQAGKPYIDKIEYPAFMGNDSGNLYLQQGKAQWGGQYIPNVKSYYLQNNPNRHIWYAPSTSNVSLYPNLKTWPTNILAVRQAISLGIDRAKVSRLGVYGYLPPAQQSGIILPTDKSWNDAALSKKYNYAYNPSKAMSLLEKAGFTKGSDGIFKDKKGRRLSLGIVNVGGFSDWVAENSLIAQSLKSIGIEVKPINVSGDDHTAREESGHFQLAYDQPGGGPTPYYQFRQWLDSANSAPIGKTASSNFERYASQQVDNLFHQYDITTSTAKQHQIIDQIQKVMLTQVPIIPVLEGIWWYQYDTTQFTGWPTPSNPYASTAPYNYPDWEVVLSTVHLK